MKVYLSLDGGKIKSTYLMFTVDLEKEKEMLKELAIQNGYTDRKLLEVLALISDDLTTLLVAEELMDGHLCELTAMKKVEAMEPVALFKDGLYHPHTQFPMVEYMNEIGVSPQKAYELVQNSYENARKEGGEIGITAPQIPTKTNMWDCYYTLSMVFSDYWITVGGDIDKASMLAYEIISDPDK